MSHGNFYFEHCPIAFRESKFDCTDAGVDSAARVHWATCTIKNTTKTFYFGCGHFSTKPGQLDDNIKAFFRRASRRDTGATPERGQQRRDPGELHRRPGRELQPDGYQQSKWDNWHTQWQQKHAGNANAVKLMPVGPAGTATKIYKAGCHDQNHFHRR